MTRIRDLALVTFRMEVRLNEDWLDAWAYLDGAGEPVSLDGIAVNFAVVDAAPSVVLLASSGGLPVRGLPVDGAVATGGLHGNVLALQIPHDVMLTRVPGTYDWEAQAEADGLRLTIGLGKVSFAAGGVP